MAILPIRTTHRGPAPTRVPEGRPDIIDEAIGFFKANVLFRNFELKGPADRVLVYLTLYISNCLTRIAKEKTKDASAKGLYALAIESFSIPGDKAFVLGGFFEDPQNRGESDTVRQYFTQLRHELGQRLLAKVFNDASGEPSKWWMCFQKRKFLNLELK
eukprot:TRINITY_DN1553_c0_g1_i2.p1 TRINITY_DN1553_c0_g1~~TRINITY_DN1553_c0_g1_i2.p1  ORF type:complete len:159 (-),score=33.21 TRINITY_DN1553_c0_g1_i2:521-997(-)